VDTFKSLCADESEGGAMVHSARSLGSAALNMCNVAEGGLDAYWEGGESFKILREEERREKRIEG